MDFLLKATDFDKEVLNKIDFSESDLP